MSYLRNNKVLLLVIAVLLLTNIGLMYFSFWKKHPAERKSMREDIRVKLISEVGLDSAQIKAYDTLRKAHFESIKPMFTELRTAKDSLFKIIHQPGVSDSSITLFSTGIFEKQQAIDLKIHRYFRSLREMCTDQQKPKLDSFLVNMASRMSWGNRRGPNTEMKSKK
jgi:hypothetical protein